MTYKELEKVNSEITYLPMGDDDYAPVAERILAFRKLYPEGFICTELSVDAQGNNIFHTSVGMYSSGDKCVLGTGTAREKEFDVVNNISPLERAETASVGRALGMAGFGCWHCGRSAGWYSGDTPDFSGSPRRPAPGNFPGG